MMVTNARQTRRWPTSAAGPAAAPKCSASAARRRSCRTRAAASLARTPAIPRVTPRAAVLQAVPTTPAARPTILQPPPPPPPPPRAMAAEAPTVRQSSTHGRARSASLAARLRLPQPTGRVWSRQRCTRSGAPAMPAVLIPVITPPLAILELPRPRPRPRVARHPSCTAHYRQAARPSPARVHGGPSDTDADRLGTGHVARRRGLRLSGAF